jgi:type I restriction-modification system DNA methylase subunit
MPKLSLAKLERHLYAAADILRREGMDAATYKDFIFGMLFLKRCSDVFEDARSAIIQKHVSKGMKPELAAKKFGDNPDYYDDFYVPEPARWPYLQEHLNDADVAYGSVMDKALAALSEVCKLNMLLHRIRGADIQLQDTLLHPMHRDAGELERFDRVIANPPFSQNYTKSNIEANLATYEQIKTDLAAARARFRELTARFVDELRARCDALSSDQKQELILELIAQDLQSGLSAAVGRQRQSLVRFVEWLWEKYAVPLSAIQHEREQLQASLSRMMVGLSYV